MFLRLKTFKKMTAFFKNKMMVQASSLGPHKHKRGRLRYLGEAKAGNTQYFHLDGTQKVEDVSKELDKILA